MIDRVAQAMHAKFNESGFGDYTYAWEDPLAGQDYFRTLARAAIAAMREPTEEMIAAGIDEAEVCTDGWTASAPCVAEHLWPVMIDAALSSAEQVERDRSRDDQDVRAFQASCDQQRAELAQSIDNDLARLRRSP